MGSVDPSGQVRQNPCHRSGVSVFPGCIPHYFNVRNTRWFDPYPPDIISILFEYPHNRGRDILISKEFHPVIFPWAVVEYTRSDRTISCAYLIHARISWCLSPGYSFRIVDSFYPEARSSRTRSTEILVPRITGLPASTEGSRIIRETDFIKDNSSREV